MADDLSPLVEAAKRGDRKAFDELVRATYHDTYTLAHRICGNEEDARDVTQDAYLRAFRSIKRFRGDAQVSTWLYRITANCAATQLEKQGRQRHDELTEELPVADDRPAVDPQAEAERGANREVLEDALRSLPPAQRAVVVLRDVYDLPHAEIAEELGITESAAKVRLHRARRKLRERLYPLPGDDDERTAHAS